MDTNSTLHNFLGVQNSYYLWSVDPLKSLSPDEKQTLEKQRFCKLLWYWRSFIFRVDKLIWSICTTDSEMKRNYEGANIKLLLISSKVNLYSYEIVNTQVSLGRLADKPEV